MHKLRSLLLILVLTTNAFWAQSVEKEADAFLTRYYQYKQVPSVTAGLMQNGKVLWTGSRGHADIENNVASTPNTVYRIASISKVFTAAAIVRLVSLNRISLDEDILYYLQDVPKKRWKFTVRQVLSHTSGLRTYFAGEFDSKLNFNNTSDVLRYLANDSLMHEPGSKYLYSSLSYTYLAALIEKATGLSYPEYMKKFIFEPAGMHNTRFDLQKAIIPNRARGYERSLTRETVNAPLADLSIKFPGGGALSTVEDLLKFGNALISGVFFPTNYLDTMMQATRLNNGNIQDYGLGLASWKSENRQLLIGHSGGGTGFVSQLTIQPDEKAIAVHLINSRDGILENPANELIKLLMGEKITAPKKPLADELYPKALSFGTDSVINEYKAFATDSTQLYDCSVNELVNLGKYLSAAGNHLDAAKWYSFVADTYPKNSQLLALCAEAYEADNNKGMALKFYKKFLLVEPDNQRIQQKLKNLEVK